MGDTTVAEAVVDICGEAHKLEIQLCGVTDSYKAQLYKSGLLFWQKEDYEFLYPEREGDRNDDKERIRGLVESRAEDMTEHEVTEQEKEEMQSLLDSVVESLKNDSENIG